MKRAFLVAFLFSQAVAAQMFGAETGNEGVGGSEGTTAAQAVVVQLTEEGFTTTHLKGGKHKIVVSNLACVKRLESPGYESCVATDVVTGAKIDFEFPHAVASMVVDAIGSSLKIDRDSRIESFRISKLECSYTGQLWTGPAECVADDQISF